MSFQRRHVRWIGIYGRRLKKQELCVTASTAINPMPLLTSPCKDDIPVEAKNHK